MNPALVNLKPGFSEIRSTNYSRMNLELRLLKIFQTSSSILPTFAAANQDPEANELSDRIW